MNNPKEICWGFIGCGEATEKKSGPAFSAVEHSRVVAVMSRSHGRAESYAKRHGIARWYTDAQELIHDPEVNAVYIATPPFVPRHLRYHGHEGGQTRLCGETAGK